MIGYHNYLYIQCSLKSIFQSLLFVNNNLYMFFWGWGCNILTSDPAVDQGTGASGRRYQGITLTVDGLNWVQIRRSQEAGGSLTMI